MTSYKVKTIKYNFIMNLILTVSNFLFPLMTFPYVSRVLQVEANGIVAYVSSIVSYFMMVASLGIPTYGIRAAAKVRDDKQKLSTLVQELLIINLILVLAVLAAFFTMIFTVPSMYIYKELFFMNAVGIFLNVIGVGWFFQAIEQYDYITIRSIFFRLLSVIMIFLLIHSPKDYILYGGISIFSSVGSNILNFKRLFKYISFKKTETYHFIPHIKPILILFAQTLVVSIYTNLDTIMLGNISGTYEVGLYTAATKLKGILLSVVTSLGNVLLPRMSYYVNNKMEKQFLEIMAKALNFTLFLSVPLSIFFVLVSKESILILAGERYLGAVVGMQLLTIAVIPNALTGVLGIQVLTPLEKEKYVLFSVIAGAIIDFVLNLLFIPLFGATGAAFATMIAEFIVLVVQIIYTKNLLREIKHQIVITQYILAIFLGIIISLVFKQFELNVFVSLFIQACLFFGGYLGILLYFRNPFIIEGYQVVKSKIVKK